MDFRTELKVVPADAGMDLESRILTLGSCFSDAIGERLADHKLKILVNPFGVIYDPESIHRALAYAIHKPPLPEHTFVYHQEFHRNFNFHSTFISSRKEDLLKRLADTVDTVHDFLSQADWLLLTYGTSWVYRRKDTGEIVANCHKMPSSFFTQSLFSVDAVAESFAGFFQQLKNFNPKIKVVLTVSPVRHLKDTLERNSVSKSVLRVACHQLATTHEDVEYFPAYEIMMDDLRDYRFYKRDMLHPTEQAEDYIWEKFRERYFSPSLEDFVRRWAEIQSALRHRPFHPTSQAHQQFLRATLKKLEALKTTVDVEQEINLIRQQMEG